MTDAKTAPPFDFDALDLAAAAETPFEFEMNHPDTGAGLGVFVSVIGAESETFQQYLRAEANALRLKAYRQRGKPDVPPTIEEEEETGLRALSACVKAWRTVIDGKSEPAIFIAGKRMEFGADNVLLWLRKFRWVRGQINEETASLANFVGNSSPASAPMPKPSSS